MQPTPSLRRPISVTDLLLELNLKIRPARAEDRGALEWLVAQFRVDLASLHGRRHEPDVESAASELDEYESAGFPIAVAESDNSELAGYLVCRVDSGVVWAESLYVLPRFRRKGTGTALYREAEKLATRVGSESVYNWIHPNNDLMIGFLRKLGYTVLNLIELRRPRPGEEPKEQVRVGRHEFDYE